MIQHDGAPPLVTANEVLTHATAHGGNTARPFLLGVVGPPGSGKSYTARRIVEVLRMRGTPAAAIPMDGFHLSRLQLAEQGLLGVKGSPETFDVRGFASLLERLRAVDVQGPVYAPDYDRDLHDPIAGRIRVGPGTRVVVVEGNYLLLQRSPWLSVGALLDCSWYLDCPDAVRQARLIERQIAKGKTPDDAQTWVRVVDGSNSRIVEENRSYATFRSDASLLEGELFSQLLQP